MIVKPLKRKEIFVCEENILEDSAVLRSKISLWIKNILKYPLIIKIILCEDQAVKKAFVW